MITHIHKQHDEYPLRISYDNIKLNEYKDSRPMFFHPILLDSNKKLDWSETLIPTIDDYKDKISYITNDYILNSIYFEFCDYYLSSDDKAICHTAMLPVNPYGPTGIGGRGLLGKWGPNHAADPVVITYDIERNIHQLLVIERKDTPGIFALPGGMQDNNEYISTTVLRELKEETNIILNIDNAIYIYSGYVNDPRNTDHAWLETNVYLFKLDENQRLNLLNNMKAGDDAKSIKLIDIVYDNPDYINLYANHKDFVDTAYNYIFYLMDDYD